MLVEISKSSLSDTNKIAALMVRRWDAVDTDNCAFMWQTKGRGKSGLLKFVLVVPLPKPDNFQDLLKFGASSTYDSVRSGVRAWSLDEALEIANKRLPKLLKKRVENVSVGV